MALAYVACLPVEVDLEKILTMSDYNLIASRR